MARQKTLAALLSVAVLTFVAVVVFAASVSPAQAGNEASLSVLPVPGQRSAEVGVDAPDAARGPGLQAAVDLAIGKEYLGPKSEPGKNISFRVYYTNTSVVGMAGSVIITDVLPLGVGYVGTVGAPPPVITYPGGQATLVYTLPALAASQHFSFTIDTYISQTTPIATYLVNVATIGTTVADTDGNPLNDVASVSTLVVGAELGITKLAPATVTAGDAIVYTINVVNYGNQAATNVVVTDRLPGGVTFLPPSAPPHTSQVGNLITWSSGITVGTGSTYTIVFTATAPMSPSGNILTNTTGVSQTTTNENNYDNNTYTTTTTIVGTPNFQLSKSDGGMVGEAGGLITYTIFYTNAGTGAAFDAVITETVPANTTYYGGGWTFVSGSTYTYNLGTVNALPCPPPPWATTCKQGQVQFIVRVDSLIPPGVNFVTNTATIAPGNVTASDSTPITGTVDLRVSKTDGGVIGQPGGLVTYTISYMNTGTKGAMGVLLTETLPAHTTYYTGGWTLVDPLNNIYVKAIGPLAGGGASGSAYFVVQIDPVIPIGVNTITNEVRIGYDGYSGPDPTPTNNIATDTTPLNAVPDLVVTKTDGGITANAGDIINYTIYYTNTGSRGATGVVLTDTIPPAYVTFVGPVGWYQVGVSNVYTRPIGSLAAGAGGSVVISMQVAGSLPSGVYMVTNTVRIGDDGANGPDSNLANNEAIDTTPLQALPDLRVNKATQGGTIQPGGYITYNINFANVGQRPATGIVLTEVLPANTTYVGSGWSLAGGNVYTRAVGSLGAGSSGVPVQFVVQVAQPFPSGIFAVTDTVRIGDDGTNGPDPNIYDNVYTLVTPISAWPDLTISKTDGVLYAPAGGLLTYTINYANVGNKTATGVYVQDTIPAHTTYVERGYGWVNMGPGVYRYNVGALGATLTPTSTGVITMVVQVAPAIPAGANYITNTATIADDGINGADPTPGNNVSIDVDLIAANPDLYVTKSDGGVSAVPGGYITYTITYGNTGTKDATGAVLTETLPAETTFSGGGGWYLVSGNTYTRSIGYLAVGATGVAHFVVQVNNPVPPGVTSTTNNVVIGDDGRNGFDLNTLDNAASDSTPINAAPNLQVYKTDGLTVVSAGQLITYTIFYTNAGNQGATNVKLQDTLPFYVVPSGGWTALFGNVYNKNIGTLLAGQSGVAYFVVFIPNGIPANIGWLTNTVTISDDGANGSDLNPGDNTSVDIDLLLAQPDMTIGKTDGGVTASAGGQISYTIFYTNAGSQDALNVTITDTLPLSTTYVGYGWTPLGGNQYARNVGTVIAGASGSISIVVQVDSGLLAGVTVLTNTVSIADDGSQGADPVLANNTATETTPVIAAPELVISKSDTYTTVLPGQLLLYTIYYTNTGTQEATNVVITETKSAYASCPGGVCPGWNLAATNVYTRNVGSLAAGASGSVTFAVLVSPTVPSGVHTIANTACVGDDGANGPEGNPFDNCASDIDTLNAAPDLVITKSDGGMSSAPGELITYTVTYSNVGTQDAVGVVISDSLSPNVTYYSGSWTPLLGYYVLNIGGLPAGAGGSAQIVVRVNAANILPPGTTFVTNTVRITDDGSNGPDMTPGDNTVTDTTPIVVSPDLVVTKSTAPLTSVAPGGYLTYTITFTNVGTAVANGVIITEVTPASTVFVGPGSWSNAGGGLRVWNAGGPFIPGTGGSQQFIVQVNAAVPAGQDFITNTVSISDNGANGPDINPADNTFTLLTTLNAAPDLRVSKDDNTASVNAGGRITYTINYTNAGNQGATGVVLTDIMPANTTFVGPGWVNVGGTMTYTYALGPLAVGASGSVQYIVDISPTLPAGYLQVCNYIAIGDDALNGADLAPGDNSDVECTPINAAPDLQVTKTDGGVSVGTGGLITYTVNYSNSGSRGATGVVLTETLPANTSYVGYGWLSIGGGLYTYNVGTLEAFSGSNSGAVPFVVQVNGAMPAGVESVTNTVTIGHDGVNGVDPTPANNSASDTTPVIAVPDLVVTKGDGNVIANPGDQIVYTINYTNTGNQDAGGVVLTETLPANTSYVGYAWTSLGGGLYRYTAPSVAAGASGSITFVVQVSLFMPAGASAVTNTVAIGYDSAGGADPTPGNNVYTKTTPVQATPNLAVTKTDGGVTANVGGLITYTINFTNTGSRGATGVVLTETLPANTGYYGAGWTYIGGGTYVKGMGSLPAGASGSTQFVVQVAPTLPAGAAGVTNTVAIGDDGANGPDGNLANNTASDYTPVNAAPDLVVTKTDNVAYADAGDTIFYTVYYTNTGTRGATGVVLTEQLPANTVYAGGGWTLVSGSTYTLSIGSLAANASGSQQFIVVVGTQLPAGVVSVTNTVSIADDGANGAEPTPGNNSATEVTPVIAAPDLLVTKTDGGISAGAGQQITYTINYTNVGTQAATGVVLTDVVPANTSYVGYGWTHVVNATYAQAVGTVPAGGSGSYQIVVQVTSTLPLGVNAVTNTVRIGDDGLNGLDPNISNNTATDSTPIIAVPDLVVTKSANVGSILAGQLITYTVNYSNTGARAATNVRLTETLPAHTGYIGYGWSWVGGSTYVQNVGTVAAGSSGSRQFVVQVDPVLPGGVNYILNTVAIGDDGTNGPDANNSNNAAWAITPINALPVPVAFKRAIDANGGTLQAGDVITYVMEIWNVGGSPLPNVVVTDYIPANTTYVPGSASNSSGPVSGPDPLVFSLTPSIPPASGFNVVTLTFAVQVNNPLPLGVRTICNQATGTSTASAPFVTDDPTTGSFGDATCLPLNAGPDLRVTKTDGGISSYPGGLITYTIHVTNVGTQPATGVVITDYLPAHTTYVASGAWIPVGGQYITQVLGLNPGQSFWAEFTVRVDNPLALGVTMVTNTVGVRDDGTQGPDLNPGDNTAFDNTPIGPPLTPTPTMTPTRTPTVTPTVAPCTDVYEPDDTFAQAKLIKPNLLTQVHTFERNGDLDYIYFPAAAGATYTITTYDLLGSTDTFLTLYDSTFSVVATNDDYPGGGVASRIIFTANQAEVMYIEVRELLGRGACGWGYSIRLDASYIVFLPYIEKDNLPPPSPTPTPSQTPTPSHTPTVTETPTITNTPTETLTPTITNTPTVTHTPTETGTPTPTGTPTDTATPTLTPTITNTPTVTNTPTQTFTPTPSPTLGPIYNIWNVSLAGGPNTITVDPGQTVWLDFDYQIANPDSNPASQRQIVIGLDATAIYCAYNGVPGPNPGATGHSTRLLTAPMTPGLHYVIHQPAYAPNCTQAMAGYVGDPLRQIATIIVRGPTATPTATGTQTATPTVTTTPGPPTATPTATATSIPTTKHPPAVVTTVAMPGGAAAQANWVIVDPVDPTTNGKGMVWVTVRGSGMVYAVSGVTNSVVAAVPVGCAPYGMTILGRRLYVANHSSANNGCNPGGASVSVIDMDSRSLITTISLPYGSEPTFMDTDGANRVFVALHWSHGFESEWRQAAVIDNTTLSVEGFVQKDPLALANDGWGLATDPAGGVLYIGTRNGATLSRYSLAAPFNPPLGSIQPNGKIYFVQVNKTTGDLYFVHTNGAATERPANMMKQYNRAGAQLATATVSGLDTYDGGGVAINRNNGNRLYVAGTDYMGPTDLVQTMWSGLGFSVSAPYRLGPAQGIQPDPLGIAVNENTYRIYVGNRGNNTLTVIEDTELAP